MALGTGTGTNTDFPGVYVASMLLNEVSDASANAVFDTTVPGGSGGGTVNGVGIAYIKQTFASNEDGGNNILTITLTDGTVSRFVVKNGSKGSSGNPGKDGADYIVTGDYKQQVSSLICSRVRGETENVYGNPVTFVPDAGSLIDVTTIFEPKQLGSGEPGLNNARPISKWDGISVHHGETIYRDTFTKPVVGGTKNWFSGVLIEDWYIQELSGASNETWKYSATQTSDGSYRYDGTVTSSKRSAGTECICTHAVYNGVNNPGVWLTNTASANDKYLGVRFKGPWPTLEEFLAWLEAAKPQVAYKVDKPVEYQLTPTIITAFEPERENTISGDGTLDVVYVRPLLESIKRHSGGGTGGNVGSGLPTVSGADDGKMLIVQGGQWMIESPATVVEPDNTKPITSAAVYATVGNIEELLKTI